MSKPHILLADTAQQVHDRAAELRVKLVRVLPRSAMWHFDVTGGAKKHRVKVQAVRVGRVTRLASAHVRVSCDCAFWQWQGPEHWATVEGYLYGKPNGTATKPDVRDPYRQHLACKHVLAALRKSEKYCFLTKNQYVIRKVTRRGK